MLTGLRGFAALMVVLIHTAGADRLPGHRHTELRPGQPVRPVRVPALPAMVHLGDRPGLPTFSAHVRTATHLPHLPCLLGRDVCRGGALPNVAAERRGRVAAGRHADRYLRQRRPATRPRANLEPWHRVVVVHRAPDHGRDGRPACPADVGPPRVLARRSRTGAVDPGDCGLAIVGACREPRSTVHLLVLASRLPGVLRGRGVRGAPLER